MLSFGDELEESSIFKWTNPASGMQIPVRVIEATDSTVKVDFNHPLAEKALVYWLKLEDLVG